MSMTDIRRLAAKHDSNDAMAAFRSDVIDAFERAMQDGVPLPHCCDIAVGIVLGAMVQAAGAERTKTTILPRMIGSMQELIEILNSPEAQGHA